MNFKLNVSITEKDYLEYNKFILLRSPYYKKQRLKNQIELVVLFALIGFLLWYMKDFAMSSLWITIFSVVTGIIFAFLFKPIICLSIKRQLNSSKMQGKLPYSPESVVEFYDEHLVDSTDTNRTEQAYSSIEKISIVGNEWVYLHVNNAFAYMIPKASFESDEQFLSFITFIESVSVKPDIY